MYSRGFQELLPWTRGQDPSSYPSTSLLAAQAQGSLLGVFVEGEGEGEKLKLAFRQPRSSPFSAREA